MTDTPIEVLDLTAERQHPLNFPLSGLSNVYLLNGYKHVDGPYGSVVSVEDLEGLQFVLTRHLIMNQKVLSGEHVRFLRKRLQFTQTQLGNMLGCSDQQIARYEKGLQVIPAPADRLLRLLASELVGYDELVSTKLTTVSTLDDNVGPKEFYFEADSSHNWRLVG